MIPSWVLKVSLWNKELLSDFWFAVGHININLKSPSQSVFTRIGAENRILRCFKSKMRLRPQFWTDFGFFCLEIFVRIQRTMLSIHFENYELDHKIFNSILWFWCVSKNLLKKFHFSSIIKRCIIDNHNVQVLKMKMW